MISTRFCPVCGAANELGRTRCFSCEHLLTTDMDGANEQTGTLLQGRYRIEATLGSGGFSAVYRARDHQAFRDVAIKQITLSGLSAEEVIEATDTFNREVSLLSTLHHPQVPQMYDHFNDREHWYLVLEYLVGPTLESYLETRAAQGKPIQIEEALAMALQLCTVLDYLHTRQPPIIFRDLKPGNIIRSPGGKLSLIDFGIARHYRPGQARDTQRLGSPGYAAPEQYGKTQTTPQSDIYSLGALLHALLSGQDPSEHPRGLAPLHLPAGGGAKELASLTQRMLSADPGERPANISTVIFELEAIRQQLLVQNSQGRIWVPPPQAQSPWASGQIQIQVPTPAQNVVPAPAKRRPGRRRVLIGLGTLTAAIAGGGIWWMNTALNTPASAPTPFNTTTYIGHAGSVTGVAWSPNGTRIASSSADKTVQVWDATTGKNVFTYSGHTDSVNAVAWSPDGTRAVSSSTYGGAQVWDASSGVHIFTKPEFSTAPIWSPDSTRIASGTLDNSDVQVWDANTGKHALLYRGHYAQVQALSWSPDGARIASASDDITVHVWDATTGIPILIYRGHNTPLQAVAWSPDNTRIVSSDQNTVQVWNAVHGSNVLTYQGHTDTVSALAWSPDGTRIASSADSTVQVWDASSGNTVFTYNQHIDMVNALAWSPDGTRIASASLDQTVKVWDAPA